MRKGPNIINDGLVFGYDTGYGAADVTTATRFYKGQPATNLFKTVGEASNVDQNVTFSVNGTGTFKRVAVNTRIGNYKVKDTDVVYSYELGENGCHYHGNDYSSVSAGTKVSFSVEYFLTSDVSIVSNYLGNFEQLAGVGGSWGSVNSQTGVWHKVSFTRTATSTGNLRMLMYPGACGGSRLSSQGKIYYKNPTVTLTEQPTPFVDGTRSSTASIIDLKETTDIDVSNVSFDSTGQPTFDGTDDYINLNSIAPLIAGGDFSLEAVIKGPTQDHKGIIPINTSSGGNRALFLIRHDSMGIHDGGTWYIGNIDVDDNNWHHVVLAYTRSTQKAVIYVDGEISLDATTNNMITVAPDDRISIGQEWDGSSTSDHFNGNIPVAKVYNRALHASEVQQNFNAYKNRFNI